MLEAAGDSDVIMCACVCVSKSSSLRKQERDLWLCTPCSLFSHHALLLLPWFQGRSVPVAHLTHSNVLFPVLAELERNVEQVVLLWWRLQSPGYEYNGKQRFQMLAVFYLMSKKQWWDAGKKKRCYCNDEAKAEVIVCCRRWHQDINLSYYYHFHC